MLPREGVQLLQNLQSTREKDSRKKKSKTRKKEQESSRKTKSTEEKINSETKAPKWLQSLAAN